MKSIKLLIVLLIMVSTQLISDDEVLSETVKKELLIGKSTTSYEEAKSFAKKMAKNLKIKLDFRGLKFDSKSFLTFSKEECQDFSDYPCYLGRGRYDDGEYISIEHTSVYPEMSAGYYIVVFATGDNISTTLTKVKKKIPDAYIKTVEIYMGCMH